MTQAIDAIAAPRSPHLRIVGVVSAAHFVSHYYILLLAPLMPFVRDEYGVSYTEIGLAFAAFNVVSALLQTPAGFLVDRLGARMLLIAGLLISAIAFALVGVVHSFWVLVAMFGLAGVGNTVFHPADYTLLSQHVPSARIGQAFSVHTFAGMLGSAVTPPAVLAMQAMWGWRGAMIGSAVLGLTAAALLIAVRDRKPPRPALRQPPAASDRTDWQVLMSAPILLSLGFFMLLAMMNAGISNYSVVAFGALFGTPVDTANAALTGYLLLMAVGVLAGGLLVGRTRRHSLVASLGLGAAAVFTVLFAEIELGPVALIAAMSLAGFFSGIIMPSRDMIVREVTPAGSFGKVFGFVTTGFNIGGIVAPLIFGAIMDHGSPRLVFLTVAVLTVAAIATVATRPGRPAAA
jgi:MFS transporter, FSR family, fosmidomycin resistance protein